MAALGSDLLQTWYKCFLWSSDQVLLLLFDPKSKMAALSTHFRLFLKDSVGDLLQTWYKYSLWGPD